MPPGRLWPRRPEARSVRVLLVPSSARSTQTYVSFITLGVACASVLSPDGGNSSRVRWPSPTLELPIQPRVITVSSSADFLSRRPRGTPAVPFLSPRGRKLIQSQLRKAGGRHARRLVTIGQVDRVCSTCQRPGTQLALGRAPSGSGLHEIKLRGVTPNGGQLSATGTTSPPPRARVKSRTSTSPTRMAVV